MKRLMTAALTLSLLGGAAAVAQPYGPPPGHDRGRHQGWDHDRGGPHHWRRGERLPQAYWGRDRYVDYRHHHLRRPPRGYQWVRVDDNYALVALTTGLIAEIIAGR